MSASKRRRFDAAYKAKVALEAIRERETLNQIATRYRVHPNQIGQWRRHLMQRLPELFERGPDRERADWQDREAELYRQIGQMKVELEWLKKKGLPGFEWVKIDEKSGKINVLGGRKQEF